VFDAFRQGEATRRGAGVGLGLSIVRALVQAHGGEIRAESDGPGCGSTFVLQLPLAETTLDSGVTVH
jgi:signal transduction histidine kinase